eukprot:7640247-Pyramimonas_sp.AAC.1
MLQRRARWAVLRARWARIRAARMDKSGSGVPPTRLASASAAPAMPISCALRDTIITPHPLRDPRA